MIIVTDSERKIRLPFSRGILTCSITLAGIDVGIAYAIATEVQKELEWKGEEVGNNRGNKGANVPEAPRKRT